MLELCSAIITPFYFQTMKERTSIKYKANLVTDIMIIKKKKRERERDTYIKEKQVLIVF